MYKTQTLTATALSPCTRHTLTATALPQYTKHTLLLLLPFHPVPDTHSLPLPFHPVPVILSLLLTLHPAPDTHSRLIPFTLYQSHSHRHCPSTMCQFRAEPEDRTLNTRYKPMNAERRATGTLPPSNSLSLQLTPPQPCNLIFVLFFSSDYIRHYSHL